MLKMENKFLSVYLRCSEQIPHLDFGIEVILSLDLLSSYLVECENSDGRIFYAIITFHLLFPQSDYTSH